ncbi:MAG: hypothetical protein WAW39_00865 [Prosthecobacter sp.]|uniref:hypothetical protein n=1 Tax=Prosthecobacter sp. TaxID=1965333 RepID=UPI003BB00D85
MKLLCLFALALLFATPCVFAQDIDPAIQQAVTNALPPAYERWGVLGLLLLAFVCRFFTARKNGLSVVDAILATLKGTNVPTKPLLLAGCLCMLSLSSCAGIAAFMASPAGQVTVALADLGLNVAAAKGKIAPGDNVAIQRGLAIVTNPADPTSLKVFSLAELGLSTAVSKGVLKQGDALLIQEAGVIIKSAFLEPQIPSAKQPVKVLPTAAVKPRQKQLKPGLHYEDGPGCMQLAERIPVYGERVAFMLSTANVRN